MKIQVWYPRTPSTVNQAPYADTSLLYPCTPSAVKSVAKSNSSNICIKYAAYRDKYFSLPSEERNGRTMNMQDFIWSKIPVAQGHMNMVPMIPEI